MKRNHGELDAVLAELRDEYRAAQLPSLETNLRREFHTLHPAARWKLISPWAWPLAGAFAAALLIGLVFWPKHKPAGPNAVISVAEPSTGNAGSDRPQSNSTPAARQAAGRRPATPLYQVSARTHRGLARQAQSAFVALPGSEGLPPPVEASIVRVRINKGDLRRYGFNVPPSVSAEKIRADFVLGEDGLPRAVRLVR